MKIGKIEQDIEIPEFTSDKYLLAELQIGDSRLYVPDNTEESLVLYNRLKSYVRAWSLRHKRNCRVRKQKDGIRVWRIS